MTRPPQARPLTAVPPSSALLAPPWLVLACALSLSACARKEAADDAPKLTAAVKTAVLGHASLERTVTAYGAVEFAPGAERTLAAPVEARVVQVLAAAGSPVAAGQTLIVLSPSPQTQIELKKAADDALTAQKAYDRAVRLQASGLDSNADVETARAANVVAQATLQSLQARAAGLTLKSPVSGVVETLSAAPGDLVATGASLAKVGQLAATRLRLGADPAQAAQVRAGATVNLTPAAGGAARRGVVQGVDPQLDAQTRLAGVIVQADGAGLALGQTVRGDIVVGQATGPVAPRGAVYYDQDQPYVLVVHGGVAHKREVTLGAAQGEQVELASGVKAGERIVVDGGASVDDGTAVKEAVSPAPESKDGDSKGGDSKGGNGG